MVGARQSCRDSAYMRAPLFPDIPLADLARFRADTATWLQANCPESLRRRSTEAFAGGTRERITNPDSRRWLDAMVERGWTVPGWPTEYGGGGLDREHQVVLRQEMARIGAPSPLGGMGVMM